MKILSNAEARRVEAVMMAREGLTPLDMIETAGEAVAGEIAKVWPSTTPVLVLAGWGNNGADALETARQLGDRGYSVEVMLFNIGGKRLSPECRVCRDRLMQQSAAGVSNVTINEVVDAKGFVCPNPDADTLVVDGLFGSGLNRPLPVSFQQLVRTINQSGAPVVAIDIPSGMFADSNEGQIREAMMHATLTLALGFVRPAFMLADNADVLGRWRVVDVGITAQAMHEATHKYLLIERGTVRRALPERRQFASKADFGNALLIAGQYGMLGAAVLAARGALRAGAGKVTVQAPGCGMTVLQTAVPCAMYAADVNERIITEIPDTKKYDAVGAGPGIGTDPATIDALEELLKAHDAAGRPLVLDAGALACIAERPLLLEYLPVCSVLTPHAGEFDRIFGKQKNDEARLRRAIEAAQTHRIIIVLKGRYTATVRPDGKVFFNSSGCPAMATPGSGDVLTGVITALMAQGFKPEKASFIGVYVHGLAGELAAAEHGDYGVTADDIAAHIGKAFLMIRE